MPEEMSAESLFTKSPEELQQLFAGAPASPLLYPLLGKAVSAAAWAEDAAGAFIQADSGDFETQAKGFGDTSGSLLRALKNLVPDDLIDRLKAALEVRHFVVHGIWISGAFMENPETGKPYDFFVEKRTWKSDTPAREGRFYTIEDLESLERDFKELEEDLERLHRVALFGEGAEEMTDMDVAMAYLAMDNQQPNGGGDKAV